nr:ABC transporter permease [Zhihengliuella flava]
MGPTFWLALAALLAVAATVSRVVLGLAVRETLLAGARALAQLMLVALLISQLGRSAVWAGAFLLLMLGVATVTVRRRVPGCSWFGAALPLVLGVLPPVGLLLVAGVLPVEPLALIAVVGQLIGGSMAAANLSGRRFVAELDQRRGEVEAALAVGMTPASARNLVLRPVAPEAMLPGVDQAKTAGTITLPGAFVGLILGGASPLDAGLIQVMVLISLMATQAVAISSVLWWSCTRRA